MIEITNQVDLSGWPPGTRMIARRQVCITNLPDDDIAYLEALYRGRGRVEQRICDAKDTGLSNLPSASFAINQAWLTVVLVAQDLLRWSQLLTLEGELARVEPQRLRYTLLHTAGVIITTGRRRFLRLCDHWPRTGQLIAAFDRLHSPADTTANASQPTPPHPPSC
ncbi:MAG: transposase [Microthrixaceae bacterium]